MVAVCCSVVAASGSERRATQVGVGKVSLSEVDEDVAVVEAFIDSECCATQVGVGETSRAPFSQR